MEEYACGSLSDMANCPPAHWTLELSTYGTAEGAGALSALQFKRLLRRLHLHSVTQVLGEPALRPPTQAALRIHHGDRHLQFLAFPGLNFLVAEAGDGRPARLLPDPATAPECLWLYTDWTDDPRSLDDLTWSLSRRSIDQVTPYEWALERHHGPDLNALGRSGGPFLAQVFSACRSGWLPEQQKNTVLRRQAWAFTIDRKLRDLED